MPPFPGFRGGSAIAANLARSLPVDEDVEGAEGRRRADPWSGVNAMTALPPFDEAVIEGVGGVLGATASGFTGGQIAELLRRATIPDPGDMTKRHRVSQALHAEQLRTRTGNCVIALLTTAMKPVRWSHDRQGFEAMRQDLNGVLAYAGLELLPDGRVHRRSVARTHDEAAATSRRLRSETQRRGGHAEVFRYCTRELVADDCFGAVFEATIGLAQRIRQMTGLDLDGYRLVDAAFGGQAPMVALNSLRSDTERNEQTGLANLMKGMFSAFRNPTAHEPRVSWHVAEPDALTCSQRCRWCTAASMPPSSSADCDDSLSGPEDCCVHRSCRPCAGASATPGLFHDNAAVHPGLRAGWLDLGVDVGRPGTWRVSGLPGVQAKSR